MKETDLTTGAQVLERIRAGLEKTEIKLGDGTPIKVTASFGLAVVDRESTIDSLMAQADQALYRAKGGGRNRVEKHN